MLQSLESVPNSAHSDYSYDSLSPLRDHITKVEEEELSPIFSIPSLGDLSWNVSLDDEPSSCDESENEIWNDLRIQMEALSIHHDRPEISPPPPTITSDPPSIMVIHPDGDEGPLLEKFDPCGLRAVEWSPDYDLLYVRGTEIRNPYLEQRRADQARREKLYQERYLYLKQRGRWTSAMEFERRILGCRSIRFW